MVNLVWDLCNYTGGNLYLCTIRFFLCEYLYSYSKDWWDLAYTETEQEGGEQWHKVQQIMEKLEDYSMRHNGLK